MSRFFIDKVSESKHVITGEDAKHIIKSLRMKVGEQLTLCDNESVEYLCKIIEIDSSQVKVEVLNKKKCANEPSVEVTLYQGLPKGDKMDLIIQKAVELGAHKVVPVMMDRCVSRPDTKTACKRVQRWQKISEQAAKQSCRGKVPKITNLIDMDTAVSCASSSDLIIAFYECGGERLGSVINKPFKNVSIFIGPEGGFEKSEVNCILKNNGRIATLGNRILRTETAPLMALSVIMYITGNV